MHSERWISTRRCWANELVKKTVNFDDPAATTCTSVTRLAGPARLITFFEWAGRSQGASWHRRNTPPGVDRARSARPAQVEAAADRTRACCGRSGGPRPFLLDLLDDPDGVVLEMATPGTGWTAPPGLSGEWPGDGGLRDPAAEAETAAETWPEPVPRHHGGHGVGARHAPHHRDQLGHDANRRLLRRPAGAAPHPPGGRSRRTRVRTRLIGERGPGNFVAYLERDPDRERPARMGAGQTHHFALAVSDDDAQKEWREKLVRPAYG